MVLEGVGVGRTQFVEPPPQLGEPARTGRRFGRRRGGPRHDRHVQCRLQRGRLLGRDLVRRFGEGCRIHPGDGRQTADPDLTDPGQFDQDLLAQGVGTETGLQLRSLGGAGPLIGCPEPLPGGTGGSLRRPQSVAVLEVGRLQVADRRTCGPFRLDGGGQLRPHAVPLLAKARFARIERFEILRGPRDAFLSHRDPGLGPRPQVLGVTARGVHDAEFGRQAIAGGPKLGRARLPCRQCRSIGCPHGFARAGVLSGGRSRLAGRDRVAVACQFAGQPLHLRGMPGRFPRHGLEVARGRPLGLLGSATRGGRGGFDGPGRVQGRSGLARRSRGGGDLFGCGPGFGIESGDLGGHAGDFGPAFQDRIGGAQRHGQVADDGGSVARHGDPAGRQCRPGWRCMRPGPAARRHAPASDEPHRRHRVRRNRPGSHRRRPPAHRGTGVPARRRRPARILPAPRRRRVPRSEPRSGTAAAPTT